MTHSFTVARFIGRQVMDDNELWTIANVGTTFDDGTTHCHLVSVQNGGHTRNGWHPRQSGRKIDLNKVLPAAPTNGHL
jgi:hypothetical protein